jgi:hypothetical protein
LRGDDSGNQRGVIWRSTVVLGYVGWSLVCSFLLGGGFVVLAFFAVWGGVWLAFSGFWRWADESRRALLHRHGYGQGG